MIPKWHQLDSSSTMPQQQESTKKKTLKSSSRSFWVSTRLMWLVLEKDTLFSLLSTVYDYTLDDVNSSKQIAYSSLKAYAHTCWRPLPNEPKMVKLWSSTAVWSWDLIVSCKMPCFARIMLLRKVLRRKRQFYTRQITIFVLHKRVKHVFSMLVSALSLNFDNTQINAF